MSASKYSSETAKRKQNSERRQHGMEKGLTSAPLWRRHAEALMRNSAKPDRGNGKACKGSVWWSAQKLGCFLWTFSKLPNLGWKPHELNPSQEIPGSSCSFWKYHKRDYFYCCSLVFQFAVWSNPEGWRQWRSRVNIFECCQRLNPGHKSVFQVSLILGIHRQFFMTSRLHPLLEQFKQTLRHLPVYLKDPGRLLMGKETREGCRGFHSSLCSCVQYCACALPGWDNWKPGHCSYSSLLHKLLQQLTEGVPPLTTHSPFLNSFIDPAPQQHTR